VIDRKDIWPFSTYAMYTRLRAPDHAQQHVLVGLTTDQPAREIEIFLEWEYLRPLYRGSLKNSLRRFSASPDPDQLKAAAIDCLRRYEERRTTGLHDGPPLSAIRVYRYVWHYDRVDPILRRATERILLGEWRLKLG